MERASCSNSCPGLFSQLKEVYLFGCNTLNGEAGASASAEVARSLIRAGQSKADAERVSRASNERHGESNRDSMRRIFANVPVIYGFSSVAPVGPAAASLLSRYFHAASSAEVGRGRAERAAARPVFRQLDDGHRRHARLGSARRLSARGLPVRRRPAVARTDARLHSRILGRDMSEVRMFLDRIETFTASLTESERQDPAFVRALNELASDLPHASASSLLPATRTNRRSCPHDQAGSNARLAFGGR